MTATLLHENLCRAREITTKIALPLRLACMLRQRSVLFSSRGPMTHAYEQTVTSNTSADQGVPRGASKGTITPPPRSFEPTEGTRQQRNSRLKLAPDWTEQRPPAPETAGPPRRHPCNVCSLWSPCAPTGRTDGFGRVGDGSAGSEIICTSVVCILGLSQCKNRKHNNLRKLRFEERSQPTTS